jgi:hypothetical protein
MTGNTVGVATLPALHAARLSPSTCRSHPSSWFELAKHRVTMPWRLGLITISGILTLTNLVIWSSGHRLAMDKWSD